MWRQSSINVSDEGVSARKEHKQMYASQEISATRECKECLADPKVSALREGTSALRYISATHRGR